MDLLEFLNGQAQYLYSMLSMASNADGARQPSSEKLAQCEMALEALANVIKHNGGVEIQCIGHFRLLFCLLRLESHSSRVREMALRVLGSVTGSAECVNDIAANQVLPHLIQAVYGLPAQQALSLGVLHSLVGDTRLVKECLASGGMVCLVRAFACGQEQEVREKAADVLSKMTNDKLMGPKVRIALAKFLPEIFLDAIKKSPETGVQMFESTHENPELIWNDKARDNLVKVITKLSER